MKKKIGVSLLLIIVMIFCLISPVSASSGITVFYNGERLVFDVPPTIIDGRTLVPLRTIFEYNGAAVIYNEKLNQIQIIKGTKVIILTIGDTYATVTDNGILTECTLDIKPIAVDGRTLVPLRFVCETLGAEVNWNSTAKTISIITPEYLDSDDLPETGEMTAVEIARMMAPRCVVIECYDSSNEPLCNGSGFFINNQGNIVTNYHVVADAVTIIVFMNNGNRYQVKEIKYIDISRDIVVLYIDINNNLYVSLGNSDLAETGDKVYTFGSPLGIPNTISEGLISNSTVYIDDYDFIQFSAPVSPGSSGGALINRYGQVIGITSQTYVDGQNMNLAIPINDLKALIEQKE